MIEEDIMKELNKILEMWAEDSKIVNNLDDASRSTPMLHAKYLPLLAQAKVHVKKLEAEQKKLLKNKWAWYNGKMTKEQMDALGWSYDPLDGLRVMKSDMDMFYDSDPDIQKSVIEIGYWKTIIDTLSEILENIKWRHQTIGNIIKWRVFEAGG